MIKVLFLDRDGIINRVVKGRDGSYDSPQKVDDVSLVDGIDEIIKWANTNGFQVFEISNQPGVAKGKMSMVNSENIEKRINTLLMEKGVRIDKKYICYHHPKGIIPELTVDCNCRKPKPGLLIQASKEFGIDLKRSVFLGDRDWDVIAGKSVGCKTIIFLFKDDSPEKIKFAMDSDADYKVWSLSEALKIIKRILK